MDAERWKQVDQLLESALGLPPERREEFLHRACGGDAALEEEAAAPHPMGDGRIDDQQPQSGDEQDGGEADALDISADDQRRGDDRESHLVHREERFGNGPLDGLHLDAAQERLAESAPPGIGRTAVAERDAITDDHPRERDCARRTRGTRTRPYHFQG